MNRQEQDILNILAGGTFSGQRELAEESGENIKTLIYRKGVAVKSLRRQLADLYEAFGNTME